MRYFYTCVRKIDNLLSELKLFYTKTPPVFTAEWTERSVFALNSVQEELFLRMTVPLSTVCSWHSSEAVERSSWQYIFLTLQYTSSHVSYVVSVFGTAENIYLQHRQLMEVIEVKQTAKSTKPEMTQCTHRGRELQLWSLSVALLEELTGHQLCHLKNQKRGM